MNQQKPDPVALRATHRLVFSNAECQYVWVGLMY